MWKYVNADEAYLAHAGKKGMKWGYNNGKRNGKRTAGDDDGPTVTWTTTDANGSKKEISREEAAEIIYQNRKKNRQSTGTRLKSTVNDIMRDAAEVVKKGKAAVEKIVKSAVKVTKKAVEKGKKAVRSLMRKVWRSIYNPTPTATMYPGGEVYSGKRKDRFDH